MLRSYNPARDNAPCEANVILNGGWSTQPRTSGDRASPRDDWGFSRVSHAHASEVSRRIERRAFTSRVRRKRRLCAGLPTLHTPPTAGLSRIGRDGWLGRSTKIPPQGMSVARVPVKAPSRTRRNWGHGAVSQFNGLSVFEASANILASPAPQPPHRSGTSDKRRRDVNSCRGAHSVRGSRDRALSSHFLFAERLRAKG